MISPLRPCSILLFLFLAFFANTSLGQSLSIINKGESDSWVVASAPGDTPYALQASKNLNLWLDVNDAVSGTVSDRVGTGVTQRYFRLVPWTEPPPITVVLVGDSTVADLASN